MTNWGHKKILKERCGMAGWEAEGQLRLLSRRTRSDAVLFGAAIATSGPVWMVATGLLVRWLSPMGDGALHLSMALAITTIPLVTYMALLTRWHSRRQRDRFMTHLETPLCFKCGYPLWNLPENGGERAAHLRCPECGHESPVARPGAVHAAR
jgi:hypothetical protein